MSARNVTTAVLAVLFAFAPVAKAGRIVVANDDWIWFTSVGHAGHGFEQPSDGAQFALNVAQWFVGNSSSSFLAYGGWPNDPWPILTHPGLADPELRNAMESAGHQWTVDNTVTFDLPTLLEYDAVFIGVICDQGYLNYCIDIDNVNAVLIDYVNAGGNVYVFSGGSSDDPTWWDFLETFGLDFDGNNNNSLYGHIPVSSTHELFTDVDHLYHVNGRCIIDLDPVDLRNQIIVTDTFGRGLFAVYDPYYYDSEGPVTINLNVEPTAINTVALVTATIDDWTTGGSNIQLAEYSIDGSGWYAMFPCDGSYDEIIEDVDGTISAFSTTGIHEVCVRGKDGAGNYGLPECVLLPVYDPEDGFVTGGGWIWSPVGACIGDPLLEGKASFGFVSKYKKGAEVPTGNTEFQFKAGDLNFHSSSYDWLVVTGSNYARFKGTGTINGYGGQYGDYKFMLWAGDDATDTFRIRIWEEDEATGVETDVYDNGFNQEIGGGSIVIHAK